VSTVAVASAILTGAGMIATPLAAPRGRIRRRLAAVVVSGLFVTTTAVSGRRRGWRRAGLGAGLVGAVTAVIERVGTGTGFPFGRYRYTDALRPTVAGVPLMVPLAWSAMAMPAREVAHAALGGRSSPVTRIGLGAAALTAWDVFLDPQMVGEGYWRWTPPGRYRGIPLTNFAGWFLTGLGVMAVLERVFPPLDDAPERLLVAEYATMAAMETIGFARYFRDPTVAVVGAVAMLPISIVAVARMWRA
jgi:putative membrane protein